MADLRCADTPLARWLAEAMGTWVDPETGMLGISQRRLSGATGVSQTQIHAILKQGHRPGADILKSLAGFFAVELLELLRLAYLEEEEGDRQELSASEDRPADRNAPGERIRAARVDRGWTQQELAARFGCSQQNISDIERGKISIDLPSLERMARVLNAHLFHFLPTAEIGAGEEAVLQDLRYLPAGAMRDTVFAAIRLLVTGAREQLGTTEGE